MKFNLRFVLNATLALLVLFGLAVAVVPAPVAANGPSADIQPQETVIPIDPGPGNGSTDPIPPTGGNADTTDNLGGWWLWLVLGGLLLGLIIALASRGRDTTVIEHHDHDDRV
jgi:hypothetical protein